MAKWNDSLPVYVTNPTSNGLIADFTMNIWVMLFIYLLGIINAIGWGTYGVIELVGKVI